MSKTFDIQEKTLKLLKDSQEEITVILLNGFQIQAKIEGYDNFSILLNSGGKQQLIYKHAISTIAFGDKRKRR